MEDKMATRAFGRVKNYGETAPSMNMWTTDSVTSPTSETIHWLSCFTYQSSELHESRDAGIHKEEAFVDHDALCPFAYLKKKNK